MSITSKDLKKLKTLRQLRADEKRAQLERATADLRDAQNSFRNIARTRQQLLVGYAHETDQFLNTLQGQHTTGAHLLQASERLAMGKRSAEALNLPLQSAYQARNEASNLMQTKRADFMTAHRAVERIDRFVEEIELIEQHEEEHASELSDEEARLSHSKKI